MLKLSIPPHIIDDDDDDDDDDVDDDDDEDDDKDDGKFASLHLALGAVGSGKQVRAAAAYSDAHHNHHPDHDDYLDHSHHDHDYLDHPHHNADHDKAFTQFLNIVAVCAFGGSVEVGQG